MGFARRADRVQAYQMVATQKPTWAIGSPPCTSYCALNAHLNYPKMDGATVQRLRAEGAIHLACIAKIPRIQIQGNRFVLHEHPQTALSWAEKCITDLIDSTDVGVVVGDQCQYGLTVETTSGDSLPAKKPTQIDVDLSLDARKTSTTVPTRTSTPLIAWGKSTRR